jgi:transposase
MEKHDIRHLRVAFLRKMRAYREEKRPIIYMDETYLHSSHTHQKGWSDNSNEGLRKPISKGNRLIIINAGGEIGFVPGAYARWKSNSSTGDYHEEMNYENFEKWVTTQLIPNLPEKAVVVVDNAPYHNKQQERHPTSATRKDDMKKWLRERGIQFNDNVLKPELYGIIKNYKPRYISYKIDKLSIDRGFDVVRLPPYHPDLNPIELVWAELKKNVGNKNITFKFSDVILLADKFFEEEFSIKKWSKICNRVERLEKEFIRKNQRSTKWSSNLSLI